MYTDVRPIRSNMDVCLQPESLATTVIWPKQTGGHCACIRWYQINRCSCVQDEGLTNVYNIGDSREDFQICWRNITNHTRIHFVIESLNPSDIRNPLLNPLVNQEFIKSFDVIIAGKKYGATNL